MSERLEFVLLAKQEGVNFRQLCRRFGVSVKTGCKWRKRHAEGGVPALRDRSRRPKHSPKQCAESVAQAVIRLRNAQPTWGGRKLRHRLRSLGVTPVPAASTCTAILRRANLLRRDAEAPSSPFQRFERSWPNELWQHDFKGHFPTQSGHRCHPLTVLDDCSRYSVVLAALADETGQSVQRELTEAFRRYGLPDALLCDNGPPWGTADRTSPYTRFTVWLLRLGVRVLHGRPYHPQTQGKDERFHRTLGEDLIARHTWRDLEHCRVEFARYRDLYNCERPHDSLQGATPVSRYRPSVRCFPETLPPIEYPLGTHVKVVRAGGITTFGAQTWCVGKAFVGLPIGLRPKPEIDGQWEIFFGNLRLGLIDLTAPRSPKHVYRSIYDSPITTTQPIQSLQARRGG